jgi:hypothetical protein
VILAEGQNQKKPPAGSAEGEERCFMQARSYVSRLPIANGVPAMLALTDESLSTLMRLASPLAPADRSVFLREVAEQLGRYEVLGEGLVARTAAEVQRRFLRAPTLYGAAARSAAAAAGKQR